MACVTPHGLLHHPYHPFHSFLSIFPTALTTAKAVLAFTNHWHCQGNRITNWITHLKKLGQSQVDSQSIGATILPWGCMTAPTVSLGQHLCIPKE